MPKCFIGIFVSDEIGSKQLIQFGYSVRYLQLSCLMPDNAELLGAMLGNLAVTPDGKFNHFPKKAPQEREASTSFLGKSWGM